MLPAAVRERLVHHVEPLRAEHQERLRRGEAAVHLPNALARKYPAAPGDWAWQWVFPAAELCAHPRTGEVSAFIFTNPSCSGRCGRPYSELASASTWAVTVFAVHSPPVCWKTATTSGQSRSFLATSVGVARRELRQRQSPARSRRHGPGHRGELRDCARQPLGVSSNRAIGGCLMVWFVIVALAVFAIALILVVREAEQHGR